MARQRGEAGQASVELIAVIPALALVTLLVAQLALAGYALWSAGVAARAGARAAYVGGDGESAARASLPAVLRDGASVRTGNGLVVRVRAPSLAPGLPRFPVMARAGLGVGDGGGR
jgi:type II secretory pathway component PulK